MLSQNELCIKGTLGQLKEIILTAQGEDHESSHWLAQMEALITQIEQKASTWLTSPEQAVSEISCPPSGKL